MVSKLLMEMIKHADAAKEFCRPLTEDYGINDFFYAETNLRGDCVYLHSNKDFQVSFYNDCEKIHKRLYMPSEWLKTFNSFGFSLDDANTNFTQELPPILLKNIKKYNYYHTFRSLTKSCCSNGIKIKHFGYHADKLNESINDFYINNTDLLSSFQKMFFSHFDETIALLKPFKSTPFEQIIIRDELSRLEKKQKESDENSARYEWKKKAFNAERKKNKITSRQVEVVTWFLKGKTTEETAEILGLSYHTVRRHFEILRSKLDCYSKNQIALKLIEMGVLENPNSFERSVLKYNLRSG